MIVDIKDPRLATVRHVSTYLGLLTRLDVWLQRTDPGTGDPRTGKRAAPPNAQELTQARNIARLVKGASNRWLVEYPATHTFGRVNVDVFGADPPPDATLRRGLVRSVLVDALMQVNGEEKPLLAEAIANATGDRHEQYPHYGFALATSSTHPLLYTAAVGAQPRRATSVAS